jgi:hypothetical protein
MKEWTRSVTESVTESRGRGGTHRTPELSHIWRLTIRLYSTADRAAVGAIGRAAVGVVDGAAAGAVSEARAEQY